MLVALASGFTPQNLNRMGPSIDIMHGLWLEVSPSLMATQKHHVGCQ